MRKNQEFVSECIDDTNQAFGVCKWEDMIVFVPNLLIEEKAKIKIVKVQKTYAYGIVLKRYKDSPYRVKPECEIFSKCGGCQYQHVDYAYQLKRKQYHLSQRVSRQLEEIEVKEVLGLQEPFYYRNKAQFPVQILENEVKMGFYRKHSNDIVDCDLCRIQNHTINAIYRCIKENITIQQATGLRHIFIRHSNKTNQSQIVLIGSQENDWSHLIHVLINTFTSIQSIVFNKNTRKDNVILGQEYKALYGNDYILEECLGNKVRLHFKSFYQVNPIQMEVLYTQAIQAAELQSNMTCIEMYSGTGTIGMAISKHVKQVLGVEIVKEAVENAQENCKLNNITNCEYICQDATLFAKDCKEKKRKVDVLFVDPPRKGMTEQGIKDIITMNPKRVIYVSCNPETLIRDLKVFKGLGYTCEYIQPVDMFAQTIGLECVAKIVRK